MIALRGELYTPSEQISRGVVLIDGAVITAVGSAEEVAIPSGAQVLDAELIAPGYIELQLNGAFGSDFATDPNAISAVAARLPQTGVTSFLPTLISAPRERYQPWIQAVRALPAGAPGAARVLGVHLEGPFLSPRRAGAHELSALVSPTKGDLEWLLSSGLVRLVTLAPELPGALELIRALSAAGVQVALGHTDATLEQARAALEAGARLCTHLFNAMPPLHHRAPGAAGALLAARDCQVALIADGVHLHPLVVQLVHRLKPGAVILVTDAIAAAGLPPGESTLAGRPLLIDSSSARLADGTLAGSVLTMDAAVRNYRSFTDCSMGEALSAATLAPARALGLDAKLGRLAEGCAADLVLLDKQLRVTGALVAGQLAPAPIS